MLCGTQKNVNSKNVSDYQMFDKLLREVTSKSWVEKEDFLQARAVLLDCLKLARLTKTQIYIDKIEKYLEVINGFEKLVSILSVTNKIQLADLRDSLGIPEEEIINVFFSGNNWLNLELQGDFLVVDDKAELNHYLRKLDECFGVWEENEKIKDSKNKSREPLMFPGIYQGLDKEATQNKQLREVRAQIEGDLRFVSKYLAQNDFLGAYELMNRVLKQAREAKAAPIISELTEQIENFGSIRKIFKLYHKNPKHLIEDVALIFNATRKQFFELMVSWKDLFSVFKIDGNWLVLKDDKIDQFLIMLDSLFSSWENEENKKSKVFNPQI